MANEITATLGLRASKGKEQFAINATNQGVDMAGTHHSDVVQAIDTTTNGIALSINAAVATLGYAQIINQDPNPASTEYIQWGHRVSGTFYPLGRLYYGEAAVFRMEPGVAYYAITSAGTIPLRVAVLED